MHVRGQCSWDTRTACSHDQIAPALWEREGPISDGRCLNCLIRITKGPVHRRPQTGSEDQLVATPSRCNSLHPFAAPFRRSDVSSHLHPYQIMTSFSFSVASSITEFLNETHIPTHRYIIRRFKPLYNTRVTHKIWNLRRLSFIAPDAIEGKMHAIERIEADGPRSILNAAALPALDARPKGALIKISVP